MPLLYLALLLSSGSPEPNLLPEWARGKWSLQDKAYSQILDEVRPFYGKDGFIDEEECAKKFTFHSNEFMDEPSSSILLMRALVWYELLLSDGKAKRINGMEEQQRKFVIMMDMWSQPVNSYHFTRTLAICKYKNAAHDLYSGNKLIEKLYAKKPSDTELELIYISWAALNPSVGQNRTTLLKLLSRQEKLEFRRKARLISLADAYKWVAFMERPRSRQLTEKSILLSEQYIASLPPGHFRNTPEFRAKMHGIARDLRSYFKDR